MLALVLASCGTGGASNATTKGPSIRFGSPAVTAAKVIPPRYKCDNRTIWLPLKWGTLPARTQELALYIVRFGVPKVASGGQVKAEIKAEALVLGLHSTLHRLKRGKLPPGALIAIHAANGEPQSVCPRKGVAENLLFRIYALNRKLHITKSSKVNPLQEVTREAIGSGTFIARYRPA
jgi:hypothetical protein